MQRWESSGGQLTTTGAFLQFADGESRRVTERLNPALSDSAYCCVLERPVLQGGDSGGWTESRGFLMPFRAWPPIESRDGCAPEWRERKQARAAVLRTLIGPSEPLICSHIGSSADWPGVMGDCPERRGGVGTTGQEFSSRFPFSPISSHFDWLAALKCAWWGGLFGFRPHLVP